MATNLDAARIEIQRAVEHAVGLAESGRRQRFWEFEGQLWTLLMTLGRALVALHLLRQSQRPRAVEYTQAGLNFVLEGERTSALGTRFGKVDFTRPVGRRVAHRRAAVDLPLDRELGLCSGFSVGVVMAVTRLCAQMAFLPARDTFRYFHEWTPSTRAVLRMVDSVGEQARPFLEELPAPKGDGDLLVIEVDGGGAPMISPREHEMRCRPHVRHRRGTKRHCRRAKRKAARRERRAKGDKSKNSKVAFVGILYTLRKTPHGREGPLNKRVYATFESHEALFIWLRREAIKRGYGLKPCLFLADGSEHIWRLQAEYLPLADTCLDWYHVIEKVWAAGQCLFPEGSLALRAWVGRQKNLLRKGKLRAHIQELVVALRRISKTGPGNKGRRERLGAVINHFFHHRHRMHYRALRAKDLDIGSGAIEGAVRNLVRMRLDGPGMRWGRIRAERVLHLRCVLLNNLWAEFSAHVAASSIKLRGAPLPAQPFEAKARKAA